MYFLIYYIPESPPPADQTEQQQTAVHQHVGQKFLASLRRFWTPFSDLLRPKTRRPKLLLLILCNFLASSPYLGEQVVLYLFKRYQVGWSAGDYGLFSMVKALAQMFGTFFAMGFLSAWLRVSDPLLGSIASMSQLGSRFIYAFATTNVLMYCGAGVDILNGVMSAVARSMGSKMVSAEEQGSLHSLFAISDTVDTILSNLVYGTVYRATLEVLPGAFFLLSAADTIPPFGIFLYFMYASRHLVPRTD
jgi:PCFT/HCP family folate transporter-like MFS transporter 1/3